MQLNDRMGNCGVVSIEEENPYSIVRRNKRRHIDIDDEAIEDIDIEGDDLDRRFKALNKSDHIQDENEKIY
jgi:hypothetical protein